MLLEVAQGRFPFPADGKPLTAFEMLQCIVEEPVPRPPPGRFSNEFTELVDRCLVKDDSRRPAPDALMDHPFVVRAAEPAARTRVRAWAEAVARQLEVPTATAVAAAAIAAAVSKETEKAAAAGATTSPSPPRVPDQPSLLPPTVSAVLSANTTATRPATVLHEAPPRKPRPPRPAGVRNAVPTTAP
ncbi:Dual specificity mitogen-activated protein kinase kinase 5 [Cladochytrium tenue]|nr:Dual specificity mitogen-activated protein kinase kinase 5 [Cladochytrium tenue]